MEKNINGLLYKSLVRPRIEYEAVIWSPHLAGEIMKL